MYSTPLHLATNLGNSKVTLSISLSQGPQFEWDEAI